MCERCVREPDETFSIRSNIPEINSHVHKDEIVTKNILHDNSAMNDYDQNNEQRRTTINEDEEGLEMTTITF